MSNEAGPNRPPDRGGRQGSTVWLNPRAAATATASTAEGAGDAEDCLGMGLEAVFSLADPGMPTPWREES